MCQTRKASFPPCHPVTELLSSLEFACADFFFFAFQEVLYEDFIGSYVKNLQLFLCVDSQAWAAESQQSRLQQQPLISNVAQRLDLKSLALVVV